MQTHGPIQGPQPPDGGVNLDISLRKGDCVSNEGRLEQGTNSTAECATACGLWLDSKRVTQRAV